MLPCHILSTLHAGQLRARFSGEGTQMRWHYVSCLRLQQLVNGRAGLKSAFSVPHSELPVQRPVEGKEWGAHSFGTGLTCVSASIAQPSSKEGTATNPIWQARKLSFRAERPFWGQRFHPHASLSRSTGLHGSMAPVKAGSGLGALRACPVPWIPSLHSPWSHGRLTLVEMHIGPGRDNTESQYQLGTKPGHTLSKFYSQSLQVSF